MCKTKTIRDFLSAFSLAWYRVYVFPLLALGIGGMFSCAWRRVHVFPRMVPGAEVSEACFPALSTGCMFSGTCFLRLHWHRLYDITWATFGSLFYFNTFAVIALIHVIILVFRRSSKSLSKLQHYKITETVKTFHKKLDLLFVSPWY